MDSIAALLIVVFHFFFGGCGGSPEPARPAPPSESGLLR
jgi:hypothetical protein